MDPISNLKEQRSVAAEILAIWDKSDELSDEDAQSLSYLASRLAELVQALDEWRKGGGFDPYTQKEV